MRSVTSSTRPEPEITPIWAIQLTGVEAGAAFRSCARAGSLLGVPGWAGSRCLASLAPCRPADERLVHLDAPRQPAPPRADQHRPQPVQHSPRRRIRADLQRALKVLSRDPVLGRGKQPARVKPHRQRRVHTVKDRTRRHRGAPPAAAALMPAIAQPPAAGVTTRRACKPARPAQPLQVVQAVLIGAEPGQELSRRARVVRPGARIFHSTSLLRLTV